MKRLPFSHDKDSLVEALHLSDFISKPEEINSAVHLRVAAVELTMLSKEDNVMGQIIRDVLIPLLSNREPLRHSDVIERVENLLVDVLEKYWPSDLGVEGFLRPLIAEIELSKGYMTRCDQKS